MKRIPFVASVLAAGLVAFAVRPSEAPAGEKGYKVVEVKDGGSIHGFVKLSGAAELPPVEVVKDNDKGCGDKQRPSERLVFDKDSLGVGNVVVTIKAIDAGKDWPEDMRKEERTALIDQKGCRYLPHVQVIRSKTQVAVANDDRADHNIHGFKRTMKDTQFNFSSEPGTKKDDVEQAFLEEPALYIVKCDIHPWMSAYVHVVENPYFAKTSETATDGRKPGEFVIDGVPPGEYVLVVWKEGMIETPVVADGKISSYTYSPDVITEVPVKVEAGKEAVVPDVIIAAPKK
jgi:hypothetical protein